MSNGKTYVRTFETDEGVRRYFRAKTPEEAERRRDEAKLAYEQGYHVCSFDDVKRLATVWFNTYKKGQLHARSEETILETIDRYILPVLGSMVISEVKPIHIQKLMNSVKNYSKSTQKKVLENTKSMFMMAYENGLIESTPVKSTVKAKGKPPAEKHPLTHEQTDALLAATKGTRVYPLIVVLLYTGLRIGEALGLRWSDIDFTEGTVTVNRSIVWPKEHREGIVNEEMKTAAAHRTISVPEPVIEVLKEERAKTKSVWVFSKLDGGYMSQDAYRSVWATIDRRTKGKAGDKARVERTLDFKVHPHLLRHTCITRWFEAGLDIKEIQYLAGHAEANTTLNIYTHYVREERRLATAEKIRQLVNLL